MAQASVNAKSAFEDWMIAQAREDVRPANANAALMQLAAKGLPNKRVEAYKYTDLKAILKSAPSEINPPCDIQNAQKIAEDNQIENSRLIVLGNGHLISSSNDLEGISINALTPGDIPTLPDNANDDAAILLSAHLATKQIVITIDSDKTDVETPIEIALVSGADNAAYAYRVHIEVSGATSPPVIMTYLGGANATVFGFVTCSGVSGDITIIKRQKQASGSNHIETIALNQSGDVTLNVMQLNLGAAIVRNGICSAFEGEATAHLALSGVTIASHDAHIDTTLIVDHAVPNCTSEERFKNVVSGKAKAVFQGKIIVQPDAQKTDARMMCQSLVLSEDAEIDVKPELEIFADDVQCAHGATMGDIDEDLLFYLKSRGLPEKEARRMLILAFLSEQLEELDEGLLKTTLQNDIDRYLEEINI